MIISAAQRVGVPVMGSGVDCRGGVAVADTTGGVALAGADVADGAESVGSAAAVVVGGTVAKLPRLVPVGGRVGSDAVGAASLLMARSAMYVPTISVRTRPATRVFVRFVCFMSRSRGDAIKLINDDLVEKCITSLSRELAWSSEPASGFSCVQRPNSFHTG